MQSCVLPSTSLQDLREYIGNPIWGKAGTGYQMMYFYKNDLLNQVGSQGTNMTILICTVKKILSIKIYFFFKTRDYIGRGRDSLLILARAQREDA